MSSPHLGFYLHWCWALIVTHGTTLQSATISMPIMESLRALIRAISVHEKEVLKMSDENQFTLDFIMKQLRRQKEEQVAADKAAAAAAAASVAEEDSTDKVVLAIEDDKVNKRDMVDESLETKAVKDTANDKKSKKAVAPEAPPAGSPTIRTNKSANKQSHAEKSVESKPPQKVEPEPKQKKQKKEKSVAAVVDDESDEIQAVIDVTPSSSTKDDSEADENEEIVVPPSAVKAKKRISFGKPQIKYISPLVKKRKQLIA